MRDLAALVRSPHRFLAERMHEAPDPRLLLVTHVVPFAALRPLGVLSVSLFGGHVVAGLIIALGSFVLQIGSWLGMALVLPALARQFHTHLDDRQAFALVTYASMPFWAAGVLYAVPDEPRLLYVWSRLLVAVVAVFSIYLVRQGIDALAVRRSMRVPLLGGITVAAVLIYGVLSVLMGLSAHVLIFVLG